MKTTTKPYYKYSNKVQRLPSLSTKFESLREIFQPIRFGVRREWSALPSSGEDRSSVSPLCRKTVPRSHFKSALLSRLIQSNANV